MKNWQRRTLGVLAIGGGAMGVNVCLAYMFQSQAFLSYIIILIGMTIYAWGIWCGLKMLESAPNAIRINRIFWAIQIPALNTSIIGYSFYSVTTVLIFVQTIPVGFGFHYGLQWLPASNFNYSFLQSEGQGFIGLNIFALAVFVFLSFRRRAAAL